MAGASGGAAETDRTAIVNALEIIDVEPLAARWLRLSFSDGAIVEVDVAPLIARGAVFERIRRHRGEFERVRVDRVSGTVEWPGGVDLCPDVLRGRAAPASGTRFARRVVRSPTGVTA